MGRLYLVYKEHKCNITPIDAYTIERITYYVSKIEQTQLVETATATEI